MTSDKTTTTDRSKYCCETVREERAHEVRGVPGRLHNLIRHAKDQPNQRIRNQKWTSEKRDTGEDGERLVVQIRHDDELLNGHPSFAITGTIYSRLGRDVGGGCCHDLIARVFPELEPLIKWHLCSTDGPMYYIGNTTYLAGNKDCHGLYKGERLYRNELPARNDQHRQQLDRKVTHGLDIPAHYEFHEEYRRADPGMEDDDDADRRWLPISMMDPNTDIEGFETKAMHPIHRIGKGKDRELDAARRCAIWPEATDSQLCVPENELKQALMDRLPALLKEFRADIESIGFDYE